MPKQKPASDAPPRLTVKPVTATTWADFEALFQTRGAPGYCWCRAWRANAEEIKHGDHHTRQRAMKALVQARQPIGLLGYVGGEAVAWCSLAPATSFHGLRPDVEATRETWAVTCFFVLRAHRGKGYTRQLLDAALRYAKRRGAKRLEGYPVDPRSPSYRHMGFVPLFTAAGFKEVGRVGTRRHVLTRALG